LQRKRFAAARHKSCSAASMSNAPYLLTRARTGYKFGDGTIVDTLLRDGLVDAFCNEHMGLTAERLASEFNLSRESQDGFALRSQSRYAKAYACGAMVSEFVELGGLSVDEHPRPDTSMESLATLKPAFKADGTVTPGNASGVNDGAAMLLMCSEQAATHNGWTPLAVLETSVSIGCDPARMGLGPVAAVRLLCERLSIELDVFDGIELNEAFAAQALACLHELKLSPEDDRLNHNGGAIAMGHPIGATGARLLVNLANRISRHELKLGLATLCVGGGMGTAVTLKAL